MRIITLCLLLSGKLPENPMFPGADRLGGFGYPPMITPYPYPNGASLGPFVSSLSLFSLEVIFRSQ